tara:strand:+ start:1221 stop:2171 length:951 start_codon:yes stop_codon:yes gene_type:complete
VNRLVLLGTACVLVACSRSAQFEQDQKYYKDYSNGYPSETQNPSDQISKMGQPKKRVVVFNFWNDTPVTHNGIGRFSANELRRDLFATRRMILPTDIQENLETANYVQGEQVKVAQLMQAGRKLGVSVIVIGRIARIVYRHRGDEIGVLRRSQSLAAADVEIKIFDVNAGREVMAVGKSGEASSNNLSALEHEKLTDPQYRAELTQVAVRNATRQLVPEVIRAVEKMSWQGQVAKVSGNRVYVNAGLASGLVAGDILKILTQGDDIYDPRTGAFLGRSKGQMKGTIEVVEFIGKDAAIGLVHTGGAFKKGDLIKLY